MNFIEDNNNFTTILSFILNNDILSLDIECSGEDLFNDTVSLVSISNGVDSFVINARKIDNNKIKYLLSLIKDSNKLVLGHNIKFDIKFLYYHYGELLTRLYDTMLVEVLINQGIGKQYYSLDELVEKYVGVSISKDIRQSFIGYTGDIFSREQIEYAKNDVIYIHKIYEEQLKIIDYQRQRKVMDLENSLIPVVACMEIYGVLVDVNKWKYLIDKTREQIEPIRNEIKDCIINNLKTFKFKNAADVADFLSIPVKRKSDRKILEGITDTSLVMEWVRNNININSNSQLKTILNNVFSLGVNSTSEKYLNRLEGKHELINLLLKYREYNKKITTYGDNLLERINKKTGRLHVDFNQLGTKSGRFSVSFIHQIPREQSYRSAFVARKGYKIITADYDQAELRLVGADSKDPIFIDSFLNGTDIHKKTASIIFGKPIEEVTKEERYIGKTFNFAVIYGADEYGLSYNFGLPVEDCRVYLRRLYSEYKVLDYYVRILGEAIWKYGYSSTMFGRRRYFKRNNIFNDYREMEKYKASVIRGLKNHRIQGTCADMVKIAMVNIFYNNPFGEDNLRILMQIHDEIVLEVKDDIVNDAVNFIKNTMLEAERPFLGVIPPSVNICVNDFWYKD